MYWECKKGHKKLECEIQPYFVDSHTFLEKEEVESLGEENKSNLTGQSYLLL